MAEARKDRPEIKDRAQWNSSSGKANPIPRYHGPQVIANKDNGGVKFRIGENQAHNLATRSAPDGSEALKPGSDILK